MRLHTLGYTSLLLAAALGTAPAGHAQDAKPEKYPLRLHVLAVDATYPTVRLQPNWASTQVPSGDGSGEGGNGGGGGGSSATFGGPDDLSGAGRGDLVTPPSGTLTNSMTAALSFTYEGCSRVRVAPGFQSYPARWKKPGKLEVLIPSDAITANDRPMPTQKCTLTVKMEEFVYLRLRNGTMLKVTQEAFASRPQLRRFLSGPPEALQARPAQTVSVKQLMSSPQ